MVIDRKNLNPPNPIDDQPHMLHLITGLPRSGKTTYVKQLAEECSAPVIEDDAVRFALFGKRWWGPGEPQVWSTIRTFVRTLFMQGEELVIIDAASFFVREARDYLVPDTDIVWERSITTLNTPKEVCIDRARKTYANLEIVINHMHEKWEQVTDDEGFTNVWTHNTFTSDEMESHLRR